MDGTEDDQLLESDYDDNDSQEEPVEPDFFNEPIDSRTVTRSVRR